jgi:hypothetical protein
VVVLAVTAGVRAWVRATEEVDAADEPAHDANAESLVGRPPSDED